MTELYRHYDKDDNLLYVGISLSTSRRLSEHKRGSKWFKDIETIKIERFDSRDTAEQAEIEAIKKEKPLHNVVYNDNKPSPMDELYELASLAKRWGEYCRNRLNGHTSARIERILDNTYGEYKESVCSEFCKLGELKTQG